MNEQQTNAPLLAKEQTQIDALRILALLLRHKIFILVAFVIGGVSTYAFTYYFMPNWYASTVNAVPSRRGNSLDGMLGGISSTLKDIGLSKLGGKGGSDSYTQLVVFQSRRLQDTMIKLFNLQSVYKMEDAPMSDVRAVFSENFQVTFENEGNYTITAWHTDKNEAARMANAVVPIVNFFFNEMSQTEARDGRIIMQNRFDRNLAQLQKTTDSLKNFSKKYSLFSPLDQAKAASSGLIELRTEIAKQEISAELMKTAYGNDDPAIIAQKKMLDELRGQLAKAENQPGFAGNFALKEGSNVGIEYLRLYTDAEVYSKIKAFLVPMLEQAKLEEEKNTPTFYVLDAGIPADKKGKPKRSLFALGGAFGAFVLATLFVLLRYRYQDFRKKYAEILG